MIIRKAERKQAKIKMAIQGPAGSGKTYSSLLLAKGLIGNLEKVCVIDTENGSSDLYAHLGPYHNLTISAPFTTEKYIQAIELAEAEGMEVIIIDSLSHSWEYLIDYHAGLPGNSFANWAKVTPRNNALFSKILSSRVHIIATLRVKQDYVLTDKNGKMVPEKVGLKAVQRDGVDYEFTLVFELNIQHQTTCTKDRTGLFIDCPEFIIGPTTGESIKKWCMNGTDDLERRIQLAQSIKELGDLYKNNIYNSKDEALLKLFSEKKAALVNQFSNLKPSQNGN